MAKRLKFASLCGVAIAVGGPLGLAQDNLFARDRVVGAGDRVNPEFSPQPIRAGAFLVDSNLEISLQNDSNVFASDDDEQSDTIIALAPEANIRSDWNRHEVGAQVGVTHREYSDLSDESRTDFFGRLRGRMDVTEAFAVGANVGYELNHSGRGETGTLRGIAEPPQFTNTQVGVNAEYRRDRILLTGTAEVLEFDFDDFVLAPDSQLSELDADRDFRDHQQTRLRGRAAYAVSPDLAVYAEAGHRQREFDQLRVLEQEDGADPVFADTLDTDVTDAQIGVSFQTPQLIRGDVSVGFFSEDRKAESLNDIDGLAFDADFEWLPTQLTKVSLTADRRTQELGFFNDNSAPTAVVTETNVRLDHELFRNTILWGSVGYRHEDFEDSIIAEDGDEATTAADNFVVTYPTFQLGATYQMNRRVHWEASYTNRSRSHDIEGLDFDKDIFSLTLRLHP